MASVTANDGLSRASALTGYSRRCSWMLGLAMLVAMLLAPPRAARAVITQTDVGTLFLLGNNTTANTFTNTQLNFSGTGGAINANADVLVVEISTRDNTANDLPSTITYNGATLTPAATSLGTGTTFQNSMIYYLYNPSVTTGSGLVVNFTGSTFQSNYAIDAFTLGGVDTTASPIMTTVANTEGSFSNIPLTVSGVTAGSWAIGQSTYRLGTAPVNTTVGGAAGSGAVLVTNGSGGTTANGNLWSDNTNGATVNTGALVSYVGAGSLTVTETAGGPAATHWSDALAVFAPLATGGSAWAGGNSTNWGDPGNWNPTGVPDGAGTLVNFGNQSSNPIVDLVSAGRTVGAITLISPVSTTIKSSGGNTLTLDNSGSPATINVSGLHTINAAIALNSDVAVTVNPGGRLTLGGSLGDTGAGKAFTLSGSGTLVLGGASNYGGGLNIQSGTVRTTVANALPTIGTITFGNNANGSGVLDLNGLSQQVGGLAVATGATATLQIIGNSSTAANATLVFANGTSTFAGLIKDTLPGGTKKLNLTVASGNLTLNGINNYTGTTTVNGALNAVGSSIGTGPLVIGASGTLILPVGANGLVGNYYDTPGLAPTASFNTLSAMNAYLPTIAHTLTVNSTATTIGGGANFDFGTTGTGFPGKYTTGATYFAAAWSGYFLAATTGTYTFNTYSDDGSVLWLDNNDTPVVNNNNYQGLNRVTATTNLTAGYHAISVGFYQGTGGYGLQAQVQVPGGSLVEIPNSLLFAGNPVATVANLSGSGNIVFSGGSVLTIGTDNTSTTFSGAMSGAGSLTKVGTGTLSLTGSSSYTGITTISAGTIAANSSNSLGDGSATNTLVIAGGALQPIGDISSPATRSVILGTPTTIDTNGHNVDFEGSISGANGLTKVGFGVLTLGGANTFTGGVTLNAGTLNINSSTALGATAGAFTIGAANVIIDNTSASGAVTLTANNPQVWSNNFFFIGTNDLNLGTGAVSINATRSVLTSGGNLTVGGTVTGAVPFYKAGAGNLIFTAAAPSLLNSPLASITIGQFNANWINSGGTLTLSGLGTFANANTTSIYQNSSLVLDNTTTNQNSRLTGGVASTSRKLYFGGGNLTVIGNSAANTTETSGAVTIGATGPSFGQTSGGNVITLTSNGKYVQFTALNLASIANSTVLFRGSNLGVTSIASATAGNANFKFTSASGLGLVGGGGAAGLPTVSILPWAIGDNVVAGVDNYGLATYDATFGIRLLNTSTEYSSAMTVGASTANNVLLTSSVTTVNAATTVNSVTLSGGITVSGSSTLTATSGVYAANGGNNILSTGPYAGAGAAIFEVLGNATNLAVSGNITGSGSVTKFGTGTMTYSGANSGTGNLMIEGGTFKIGSANWLSANQAGLSVTGGATLDVNGTSTTIPALASGFDGSGTITNSGAAATLALQGDLNQSGAPFMGNINNGASSITVNKTSGNPLWLAGGGNFSGGLNVLNGSLVLGSDTAQGGNTTVNVGDTSGANNAALLFGGNSFGQPGLFKTSTLAINIQAGSSGAATFGIDNSAGTSATFNGTIALNKNAFITGNFNPLIVGAPTTAASASAAGTFTIGTGATFTGSGSLTQNGGTIQWASPTGYVFPGGFGSIGGTSLWLLSNQSTPGTYSFALDGSNNPLTITLNGPGLTEGGLAPGGAALTTVVSNSAGWIVNNPFIIGASGGSILTDTGGANSTVTFTGAVALKGNLHVGTVNATGTTANTVNGVAPIRYGLSGSTYLTIDQTSAGSILGVSGFRGIDFAARTGHGSDIEIDGNIVDGTGAGVVARNGLLFSTGDWTGRTFSITGTGNTYSGGTVFAAGASNTIQVAAGSSLGTGNAWVMTSSAAGNTKVQLTAAGNLGGGAKLFLTGTAGYAPLVSLTGDFAPAIGAGSQGIIAVDTATYTSDPLNGAPAGVYLGSTAGGVITRLGTAPLTPNSGNTYDLGGGGGTLTINNGVLQDVGGVTSVVAGAVVPAGAVTGTVYLTGANTYSGATTIYAGVTLQGNALASGSPFGGSGAVNLFGGTLQLTSQGSAVATVNKGALNLDGQGNITIDNSGANGSLNFSSLNSSANHPVLNVTIGSTPSAVLGLKIASGLPATSATSAGGQILPASFLWNTTDWATYNYAAGAANTLGFGSAANGTNVETSGVDLVTGTVNAATAYNLTASIGSLTTAVNVWGLRLNGNTVTAGAGGSITLNGGGILAAPTSSVASSVPVALFNGSNVFSISGSLAGQAETLSGAISGGGANAFLIKAGPGGYILNNPGNSFQATVVLNAGDFQVLSNGSTDVTLGNANNGVILNGGTFDLTSGDSPTIASTHTFNVGPLGGAINFPTNGGTLTVNAAVIGSGPLTLVGTGTTNFNGNMSGFTGTLAIKATAASLGGATALGATANLANYTTLTVAETGVIAGGRLSNNGQLNLTGAAPSFGSLDGFLSSSVAPPVITLGNNGLNDTTLTVGADGSSSAYWGTIGQASSTVGQGVGSFTKTGSGTLSLFGTGAYTGPTTINAGKIQLNNTNLLQNTSVTVVPTNGLTFASGVGTTFSLGALSGADNFAVTSTANSPITLVVGGTNINAVSAGGLTGNGSLVKAGTGSQDLGGSNTYTGTTSVNGGVLRAASTTALGNTTSVAVASGANFDFASGSGGMLNVGSGGAATLNLASGSSIGSEVGGTIKVGVATATGAIGVDVYGSPAVSNPSGTFTLVQAASGLGGATYSLGKVYNNTNFTVTSVTKTTTTISATVATATPLAAAFWQGNFAGGNNIWSLSNGSTASNWTTDSAGTVATGLVPGVTTAVTLSASGAANQGTMILGENITISSLKITDATPVTLNADGHTLSVNGPIDVLSSGAVNLNAPLAGSGSVIGGQGTINLNGFGPNSYAQGTIADASAAGMINVAAASSLGSGDVNILSGGHLRLNSAANLGGSAKLNVAGNTLALGVVSLGADLINPSSFSFGNTISANLSAQGNGGVLAIDTTFSTPLNLATIGAGNMLLGSMGNGTYAAASLGVGAGNTYRLGGGNGTLTIAAGVLTGNNNLQIGVNSASIPGIPGFGANIRATGFGTGQVLLQAANTFTGSIAVDAGSTLRGQAQLSGSPFGNTGNSANLVGGVLELDGINNTASSTALNNITFEAASGIALSLPNIGTATVTNFTFAGTLTRNNHGVLYVTASAVPASGQSGQATLGTNAVLKFAGADPGGLLNAATLSGDSAIMVSPAIVYPDYSSNGDHAWSVNFLTYSAAAGFSPVSSADTYTTSSVNGINSAPLGKVLRIRSQGASGSGPGAYNLTGNLEVAALMYDAGANGSTNLLNASGGTTTILKIDTGGIEFGPSGNNGSATLGGSTTLDTPTLDFNGKEAIIHVWGQYANDTITAPIQNAAGLTKAGFQPLILAPVSASTFTGTVTIDEGVLQVNADNALGNAANGIVLNGAEFQAGSPGAQLTLAIAGTPTISRTLTVGNATGTLFANNSAVWSGQITGAGALALGAANGQTLTLSNVTNNWSGGANIGIGAGTVIVNNNVPLGTGDVQVAQGTLQLLGDASTAATARVTVNAGATLNLRSTTGAPRIGSLEGSGSVVLGGGSSAASFNLQIGGDNSSSVFDGVISQAAPTTAASLSKVGTGSLTLSNTDTYSSGSTVSGGILRTAADGALGTGPLAINSTSGTSTVTIASNESVSALTTTLSGGGAAQLNVAAGKTLTFNQSSGSTTFGGTVALLSGASSSAGGTLTKTGSGADILTAAPQFGNNSTLNVTGSLKVNALAGPVSVGSGATAHVAANSTLELAGTVSALGTTTPGNRVAITLAASNSILLVSNGIQQVGTVVGSGNVQANTGTSLTADHYTGVALVIGGTAQTSATIGIAASDLMGNPQSESSGFAVAGSLTSTAPFAGELDSSDLLAADSSSPNGNSTGPVLDDHGASRNDSAVPEPSTLVLLGLGGLVYLLAAARRRPVFPSRSAP